jgi:hypothetical protein
MLSIILPFFLAFSTYEFWKKSEIYYEQPKVLYRKELIIVLEGESTSVSSSSIITTKSSYFFSTMGYLNEMYSENLFPMTLDSSLLDYNFDGKPEGFEINITAFIPAMQVRNIKILMLFDYSLRERVKMDLVGLAVVDVDTSVGAGQTFIGGDLVFKQRSLLKTSTVIRTEYNETLISNSSASENDLFRLMRKNNDRNFTTEFLYDVVNVPYPQLFTSVYVKIRVPTYQKLQYAPGFLEIMKFSWIQYLSFLIPVGFFIYSFARFIYSSQILESQVNFEDNLEKGN